MEVILEDNKYSSCPFNGKGNNLTYSKFTESNPCRSDIRLKFDFIAHYIAVHIF